MEIIPPALVLGVLFFLVFGFFFFVYFCSFSSLG